jgi:hypothetical protein
MRNKIQETHFKSLMKVAWNCTRVKNYYKNNKQNQIVVIKQRAKLKTPRYNKKCRFILYEWLQFLPMSQSTLKLLINANGLSTFVIIKNTSAPLYARIATCSLTLSNSAGFLWGIYLPPNTRLIQIRLTIVYCMILPA